VVGVVAAFGELSRRAAAALSHLPVYSDSEQEEEAALAGDPLALPPIATVLAGLEQMLTDLAR
jgi:hypothetical protein